MRVWCTPPRYSPWDGVERPWSQPTADAPAFRSSRRNAGVHSGLTDEPIFRAPAPADFDRSALLFYAVASWATQVRKAATPSANACLGPMSEIASKGGIDGASNKKPGEVTTPARFSSAIAQPSSSRL